VTSDWGPPPPPQAGAPLAATPIVAEPPSYLLGSATGGVVVGLMTALFSCCCGLVIGPIGGALAAWSARQRTTSFGLREGAYAGFLVAVIATAIFAVVSTFTIRNTAERVKRGELTAQERQALQQLPFMSEESIIQSASPPMLLLNVILNAIMLFVTCVGGGMVVGAAKPKVHHGWATGPPPGDYRHPYGPPPGVPEPYAAPGFDEQAAPPAPEEPRYSTAWKEVSPEELALPITLEDDAPPEVAAEEAPGQEDSEPEGTKAEETPPDA
jgi:hypothetical protein